MKVTVTDPPSHALGACALLTLNVGLHPPLTLALDAHATNAASISACVKQPSTELSAGTFKVTAGAGVTVNVAVSLSVSQLSETVKVTVAAPPSHALGACALLTSSDGSHPPPKLAPSTHAANAASIAACVIQPSTV